MGYKLNGRSKTQALYYITLLITICTFIINGCQSEINSELINEEKQLKIGWSEIEIPAVNGEMIVPSSIAGVVNDMWIAGRTASSKGVVLHFDGSNWKDLTPSLGFNTVFTSVYYRSSKEVFVGGSKWRAENHLMVTNALLLKYDGSSWSTSVQDTIDGTQINKIDGISGSNLWAGGTKGALYNEGTGWHKCQFPDTIDIKTITCSEPGKVFTFGTYILSTEEEEGSILFFSEVSGNTVRHIDTCHSIFINSSLDNVKFGLNAAWSINSSKVYSVSSMVFNFNGSSWHSAGWANLPGFLNTVKGTSGSNIYTAGTNGSLLHFDGTNWKDIPNFISRSVNFCDLLLIGNDIYLTGNSANRAFLFRGQIQ